MVMKKIKLGTGCVRCAGLAPTLFLSNRTSSWSDTGGELREVSPMPINKSRELRCRCHSPLGNAMSPRYYTFHHGSCAPKFPAALGELEIMMS
jgi:hypothetical protein